MSNFSELFQNYGTETAYEKVRDTMIETDEGNEAYGQLGGAPYTLGYGYDISKQSGSQIISDFSGAGIFTPSNTTGSGVYAALYTALESYTAPGTGNAGFAAVNADFAAAFASGLTTTQAVALLNQVATTYESDVSNTAADNGLGTFPTDNNGLHALLFSEDYNGGNIFGPIQADDIATDNVPAFIEDVLFNNNTQTIGGVSTYVQGLENRRINDIAAAIGLPFPSTTQIGRGTVDTGLNFGKNYVAAVQVYGTLMQYNSEISSRLSALGSAATTNLDNFISNTEANALATINTAGSGYYLIPVDTTDLSADSLATTISGITGVTITGAQLTQINSLFSDGASFTAGGFLHVPTGTVSSLSTPNPQNTYVTMGGHTYEVGASLDGSTNGALINVLSSGQTVTLNAGAWQDTSGSSTVALNLGGGAAVKFNLDPSITLPDGTYVADGSVIDLPSIPSSVTLTAPTAGETAEEALLADLSALGDSVSASTLDAENIAYLNPVGSPSAATSHVVANPGNTSATVYWDPGSGTIFDGQSTATIMVGGVPTTVPATNVIELMFGGNFYGDTISNIQTLLTEGVEVTLTQDEFNGFSNITGGGYLIAATGGTFDLNASNVTDGGWQGLVAEDWSGTTLIGNNDSGQTITASLFGNDTLTAGNGLHDVLVAGEGVDTITGGTGGDTFEAENGLADGSSVTGNGTGNIIEANGDISGATVSGIQTLELDSGGSSAPPPSVTLTASEFGDFTTVETIGGKTGTIYAGDAGTYDLGSDTTSGAINMSAQSTSNDVTLIGSNQNFQVLTGGSGTDTLEAGTGADDTLVAGSGNNTLIAGSTSDTLIDGSGVDTLESSSAFDTFDIEYGTSGTTVSGGFGATLEANVDDISNMTISGITAGTLDDYSSSLQMTVSQFGEFNTLVNETSSPEVIDLTGSGSGTYNLGSKSLTGSFNIDATNVTGNVTLVGTSQNGQTLAGGSGTDTLEAGNGTGDVLSAGSGNTTLVAGTGGDTLYDGSGVDTLEGGTGNDTFDINYATSGTAVTGGGGDDTLSTDISNLTGVSITGVTTLDDDSSSLQLTASQFSEFTTLVNESSSPETIVLTGDGTYDLSGVTVSGQFIIDASGTTGDVTLTGSNQDGETLTGGTGTDTITTGSGTGDVANSNGTADVVNLNSTDGTANITGGGGSWTNANADGETINDSGSGDTIESNASGQTTNSTGNGQTVAFYGTGSSASISGDGTWSFMEGNDNTLTTTSASSNSNITADGTGENITIAGDSNVVTTTNTGDTVNVTGTNTWANVNGDSGSLTFSDTGVSNDSINTNGNDDSITATGDDNTDSVTLSGTGDTLAANGSNLWVNVEGSNDSVTDPGDNVVINIDGSDGNSADISGANAWVNINGNSNSVTFSDTGVDDDGINANGNNDSITAEGNDNGDAVTLSGTADSLNVSSTSTNLWINVNGSGDTVSGAGGASTVNINGTDSNVSGGEDWFNIADGVSTQIGGGDNSFYDFGSTLGTTTIDNTANGTLTSANGGAGFGSGITDEDLWFEQSGNNLVLDLIGTTNTITFSNWFGSNAGAQVQSFQDGNGLTLDTQISSLISAMATYASNNPSFNPQTASSMPTDTTLQSAIASAWHS